MVYFEATQVLKITGRRQVACRLVWDQDIGCSIHPAPTKLKRIWASSSAKERFQCVHMEEVGD